MKTRTILILAAIAIPLVSCNKDKVDPTPAGPDYQEITFKAKAAAIEGVDLDLNFDGLQDDKDFDIPVLDFTDIPGLDI